ncbi:MAG: hypothetical protein AAB377_02925 [Patescibacteria group bacterium]
MDKFPSRWIGIFERSGKYKLGVGMTSAGWRNFPFGQSSETDGAQKTRHKGEFGKTIRANKEFLLFIGNDIFFAGEADGREDDVKEIL